MAASFPHCLYSSVTCRQLHRITEWWRLKGSVRDHLVQPCCSKQCQLEQVAQGIIHSRFEYVRDGDSTTSPGNLFHYLTTFTIKRGSPLLKLTFLCFSLCPLPLVLSLGNTENSLASCSLLPQHQVFNMWIWVTI